MKILSRVVALGIAVAAVPSLALADDAKDKPPAASPAKPAASPAKPAAAKPVAGPKITSKKAPTKKPNQPTHGI